jgi:GTP pyrophosphokinase
LQSRTHQWLQSLLEIQRQTGDSSEFLEHIKVDLFPDKVYVFTPKGKIVSLPRGATVVDFAYSIHTDVGNKCVAARINGEIQPLRTPLRNGDMVEVVTGPVARPNPAWLTFVHTGKARSEIRHFLRTMKFDESVELGERLLSQAARQFNLALGEVTETQWETVLKQAELASRNDLLADIGLGRRLAAVVARQFAIGAAPMERNDEDSSPRAAPAASSVPVLVRGSEGMAVQLANCCHPIPGDSIIGHIRKGQGLAVHQADCMHAQRARRADPERWIELQWASDSASSFTVGLDVGALNERGVLGRIAVAIAEGDSNILNVHVEDEDARVALIHFKIQVRDRVHLARVIRALRRVRQVVQIARPRGGARGPGHQDAS